MIRKLIALSLIGMSLAAVLPAAENKDIAALEKQYLANEQKGRWKQIDWQPDMDAALKLAQKGKKPILVFIIVGESGRKDAARC